MIFQRRHWIGWIVAMIMWSMSAAGMGHPEEHGNISGNYDTSPSDDKITEGIKVTVVSRTTTTTISTEKKTENSSSAESDDGVILPHNSASTGNAASSRVPVSHTDFTDFTYSTKNPKTNIVATYEKTSKPHAKRTTGSSVPMLHTNQLPNNKSITTTHGQINSDSISNTTSSSTPVLHVEDTTVAHDNNQLPSNKSLTTTRGQINSDSTNNTTSSSTPVPHGQDTIVTHDNNQLPSNKPVTTTTLGQVNSTSTSNITRFSTTVLGNFDIDSRSHRFQPPSNKSAITTSTYAQVSLNSTGNTGAANLPVSSTEPTDTPYFILDSDNSENKTVAANLTTTSATPVISTTTTTTKETLNNNTLLPAIGDHKVTIKKVYSEDNTTASFHNIPVDDTYSTKGKAALIVQTTPISENKTIPYNTLMAVNAKLSVNVINNTEAPNTATGKFIPEKTLLITMVTTDKPITSRLTSANALVKTKSNALTSGPKFKYATVIKNETDEIAGTAELENTSSNTTSPIPTITRFPDQPTIHLESTTTTDAYQTTQRGKSRTFLQKMKDGYNAIKSGLIRPATLVKDTVTTLVKKTVTYMESIETISDKSNTTTKSPTSTTFITVLSNTEKINTATPNKLQPRTTVSNTTTTGLRKANLRATTAPKHSILAITTALRKTSTTTKTLRKDITSDTTKLVETTTASLKPTTTSRNTTTTNVIEIGGINAADTSPPKKTKGVSTKLGNINSETTTAPRKINTTTITATTKVTTTSGTTTTKKALEIGEINVAVTNPPKNTNGISTRSRNINGKTTRAPRKTVTTTIAAPTKVTGNTKNDTTKNPSDIPVFIMTTTTLFKIANLTIAKARQTNTITTTAPIKPNITIIKAPTQLTTTTENATTKNASENGEIVSHDANLTDLDRAGSKSITASWWIILTAILPSVIHHHDRQT